MTLPLKYKTPDKWAQIALEDTHALLSDHAYLERKAASNALEMLNRWPEPNCPENWSEILAQVAKDESLHLHMVLKHLKKRKGKLARLHKSQYANDLRSLVRKGEGPREILDRLLISALIEARSCERFDILGRFCEDKELATFYKSLWSSEKSHFQTFLKLGQSFLPKKEVDSRWDELLTKEAIIIQRQPSASGIHSGL